MTSTDDNMFDEANRPFLLAASKYRAKLQKSDTEDLFSIARRLRTQFEAKKAADAADAKKPAATLSDTDRLALHRPGSRTDARPKNGEGEDETNSWEHDRRKRQTTKHVRSDEPERSATEPEEALSDSRTSAIDEYRARISDEWRTPSIIEDERRKKRWQTRDPQGRESGSGEEETETDADCNAEYEARQRDAWKTLK